MASASPPRKSLVYPSLHLGSFDNIQEAGIPSSSGPRASSNRIQSATTTTTTATAAAARPVSRQSSGTSNVPDDSATTQGDMPGGLPSGSSQQSLPWSPSHTSSLLPAPLGLSLPPLPSISPISFGLAPSPTSLATPTIANKHSTDNTQQSGLAGPLPVPPVQAPPINLDGNSSPAPAPSATLASAPSTPARSDDKRVGSGPVLSVQIPRSPSPSPPHPSADDLFTVRDSPSMARRRKVVEADPNMRIVSGRVAAVGELSLDDDDSPLSPNDGPTTIEGSISMPVAQPHIMAPQAPQPVQADFRASHVSAKSQASQSSFRSAVSDLQDPPRSPRRLENKQSTSPDTPRRSLPRPPLNLTVQRPAGAASPALNGAAESSGVFGPSTTYNPSGSIGRAGASTNGTMGPTGAPRHLATGLNNPPTQTQPLKSPDLPQVVPRARHAPVKSASSMPVVGGLADAGPYPSASPNPPQLGLLPANPAIGLGRPNQQPGAMRRRPQEEICIECMMRDRDLADVDVTGEHVWDRQSDFAFEEKKAREEEMLRSIGGPDSRPPSAIPSLDHSLESDDDVSAPSTHDSVEDVEAKRRAALRKEQKRARRREVDYRLVNAVGWRGFKWEEGEKGEGLPKGFRGTRGGPLSEAGIKQVMLKFPSGSAYRHMHMERYLYYQALLIREVRINAEKLGYYPGPDDAPVVRAPASTSSEGHVIIAGPRTSSVAWGAKRDINEQMRSAFDGLGSTQASPAPNTVQTVRPSPSSPADLAGMASKRVPVPPLTRPLTTFYPDREPAPPRSPISAPANQRKSYASSKAYEQSMLNDTEEFVDGDDSAWPPLSPAESGLRPFSFAVRAGATAGRGSSDGHGARRSLLGRWGGSVTSFFGGSQGGSASVIDMHIGLDSERQQQTSSNYVHAQARAVSLASPTRPAFFSRDSRRSTSTDDRERMVPKSISTSRLSQVFLNDPAPAPAPAPVAIEPSAPPEKTKGFKGLLQKMRPRSGHKKGRSHSQSPCVDQPPRSAAYTQPGAGRLVPPPPMSYLANAASRDSQGRDRSSSTSTMYTDNSGAVHHAAQRGTTVLPYNGGGFRSVSAPGGSSSNGSQSNSPTDSRFKRDSYASGREDYDNRERRASGMEVLTGGGTNGGYTQVGAFPPHALRPHNNKTTPSLSASSMYPTLETPLSAANGAHASFGQDSREPGSPNRFKNLPPIPPPRVALSSSPDSFNASFADANQLEYQVNGSSGCRQPIPPQQQQQQYHLPQQHFFSNSSHGTFPSPSTPSGSVPNLIPGSPYAPPRASYDALNDRGSPKVRVDARMAQSMYVDSSQAPAFGGPYGQIHAGAPRMSHGNGMWTPMREDDGANVKKARGLRGLFGASKAGRVA